MRILFSKKSFIRITFDFVVWLSTTFYQIICVQKGDLQSSLFKQSDGGFNQFGFFFLIARTWEKKNVFCKQVWCCERTEMGNILSLRDSDIVLVSEKLCLTSTTETRFVFLWNFSDASGATKMSRDIFLYFYSEYFLDLSIPGNILQFHKYHSYRIKWHNQMQNNSIFFSTSNEDQKRAKEKQKQWYVKWM